MAKGFTIQNQQGLYFLTFTIVGWIDVFTRDEYRKIIIDSFNYCKKEKGLLLFSYVIMSNHIHIIARTDNEKGLSAIVRDFKKFTSVKIISAIENNRMESRREWMLKLFKYYAKFNSNNPNYQFWKQDNHPIELISDKWVKQKLDYIHLNPVRAGWVTEERDFKYSSARNYQGEEGVLDVVLLDVNYFQ
ncbi:MAG: REP-associated tyrosine transposase [Saprospiraceae bacterium]